MKKIVVICVSVGIAAFLAVLLFVVILPSSQYEKVRSMQITNVDLKSLSDGTYHGEYAYSNTDYKVDVEIKDHQIVDVKIDGGGASEYSKLAEGVIDKIIEEQRLDVDAISGATTSSKAILKAVENALVDIN